MLRVLEGDSLEVLRRFKSTCIDAVVTDPPAGIGFMGKAWDGSKGGRDAWIAWLTSIMAECFRVLKPGGHTLVWALPRTSHWTATAVEDAGFEIRDVLMHLFGTGFPKSLDVSKAIDKAAGAEREVVGHYEVTRDMSRGSWADLHGKPNNAKLHDITAPATDDAARWAGWGTALKPAAEHWILARKPLTGTVAANVLEHGTGAINIDGCRVGKGDPVPGGGNGQGNHGGRLGGAGGTAGTRDKVKPHTAGRWPANVVLSHEPDCPGDQNGNGCVEGCAVRLLGEQSGPAGQVGPRLTGDEPSAARTGDVYSLRKRTAQPPGVTDSGTAARFFYQAKPSRAEREAGVEAPESERGNKHPTVKSIDLMRWLCRLITPPDGVVLDPFCGSGSTGCAAALEGFSFLGIEQDPAFVEIAKRRIEWWASSGGKG